MSNNNTSYNTPELNTNYDAIFIIDFLPEKDREEHKITDKLITFFHENSLPVAKAYPNNRDELLNAFAFLQKWVAEGTTYFLQFVGHGNEDGIQVGYEIVTWSELSQYFVNVNILSDNSLLLNMSTCKGINAVRSTNPKGSYPFFGVIGASKNLLVDHAIAINEKLYKKMIDGMPLQKIIPKINEELNEEVLFIMSTEGYRKINK
jgi:hypothetical protein